MGIPIRVLLVEDSPADAELALFELRKGGYELISEVVDTPEAMSEALSRQDWDIVIADYVLPNFSGLAALEVLTAQGMDLPFIIVSGQIGEDAAVEAMKAGAGDYILKGNLTRLVPAIERELREAKVRQTCREADEALRKAYAELEGRVEERTAELAKANEVLQGEIAERKRAEMERESLLAQVQEVNSQLAVNGIRMVEQAEEAERRAAELDATIMAIADAVIIYDAEGRIARCNPAAERMLGYSPDESHLPDDHPRTGPAPGQIVGEGRT